MKKKADKKNCWEIKGCGREIGGVHAAEQGVCPAATFRVFDGIHGGRNGGRACWVVAGTLCTGKPQGTFAQKYKDCSICDFYRIVREEEKDLTPAISLLNRIEFGSLVTSLRTAIEKKQELYKLFSGMADAQIGPELKSALGHCAYEEFIGLTTLMDWYKDLVDRT